MVPIPTTVGSPSSMTHCRFPFSLADNSAYLGDSLVTWFGNFSSKRLKPWSSWSSQGRVTLLAYFPSTLAKRVQTWLWSTGVVSCITPRSVRGHTFHKGNEGVSPWPGAPLELNTVLAPRKLPSSSNVWGRWERSLLCRWNSLEVCGGVHGCWVCVCVCVRVSFEPEA